MAFILYVGSESLAPKGLQYSDITNMMCLPSLIIHFYMGTVMYVT